MVDFFLQNVGVILIARPSKRGRTSSPLHIVCIKLIPTTYNLWSDYGAGMRKKYICKVMLFLYNSIYLLII